jgi:hypothetical protein
MNKCFCIALAFGKSDSLSKFISHFDSGKKVKLIRIAEKCF